MRLPTLIFRAAATTAAAVRDRRYPYLAICLAGLVVSSSGIVPSALARSSISVAAAANLTFVVEPLNAEFKRTHSNIVVTTTTAASGSLFAQIRNGAPFDVFLSADMVYPQQLVEIGAADPKSLVTFATGRLVFWTARRELDVSDIAAAVRNPAVKKIAIAQPKTAPYGRAAQATLAKLAAWRDVQVKLVVGESISQTAQFIETGNADAGFVAMSVVCAPKLAGHGRWIEVPPALYSDVPLDHAAVLTTRGVGNAAAKRFLEFLQSEAAKKILRDFGYRAN